MLLSSFRCRSTETEGSSYIFYGIVDFIRLCLFVTLSVHIMLKRRQNDARDTIISRYILLSHIISFICISCSCFAVECLLSLLLLFFCQFYSFRTSPSPISFPIHSLGLFFCLFFLIPLYGWICSFLCVSFYHLMLMNVCIPLHLI